MNRIILDQVCICASLTSICSVVVGVRSLRKGECDKIGLKAYMYFLKQQTGQRKYFHIVHVKSKHMMSSQKHTCRSILTWHMCEYNVTSVKSEQYVTVKCNKKI